MEKLAARNAMPPRVGGTQIGPLKKRLYARMELYAGALSYTDYDIGRFLDASEESGKKDDAPSL
jgi:arylsulfatase A-like enzyme